MSIRKTTKGAFGRGRQSRLCGLGLEQLENRQLLAVEVFGGTAPELGEWTFKGSTGSLFGLTSGSVAVEATENTDSFALRWVDPTGDIVHLNVFGKGTYTFTLNDAVLPGTGVNTSTVSLGNMDIRVDDTNIVSSMQIITNPNGLSSETPAVEGLGANGFSDVKLIQFSQGGGASDFGDFQTAQARFSDDSGNVGINAGGTDFGGTFLRVGDVNASGLANPFLSIGGNSTQNLWQIYGGSLTSDNGQAINIGTTDVTFEAVGVEFPNGQVVEAQTDAVKAAAAGAVGGGTASSARDANFFTITDDTTQADLDEFFDGFTFTRGVTITIDGDPAGTLEIGDGDTVFTNGLGINAGKADTLTKFDVLADFQNSDLNVQGFDEIDTFEVDLDDGTLGNVTVTGADVTKSTLTDMNIIDFDKVGNVTVSDFLDAGNFSVGDGFFTNGQIGDVSIDATKMTGISLFANIPGATGNETIGNVTLTGDVDGVGVVSITATESIGDVTITGDVSDSVIIGATAGTVGNTTIDGEFAAANILDIQATEAGNITVVEVTGAALGLDIGNTKGDTFGDITVTKGDLDLKLSAADMTLGNVTVTEGLLSLDFNGNTAATAGLFTSETIAIANDIDIGGDFGGIKVTDGDLNFNGKETDIDGTFGEITVEEGAIIGTDGNIEVTANNFGNLTVTNKAASAAITDFIIAAEGGDPDDNGNPIEGNIGNITITNEADTQAMFAGGAVAANGTSGNQIYAAGNIANITLTASKTDGIIIDTAGNTGLFIGAGDNNGASAVGKASAQTVSIGTISIAGDLDYTGVTDPFGTQLTGENLMISSGYSPLGASLVNQAAVIAASTTWNNGSVDLSVAGSIADLNIVNTGGGTFTQSNPAAINSLTDNTTAPNNSPAILASSLTGDLNGVNVSQGQAVKLGETSTTTVDDNELLVAIV